MLKSWIAGCHGYHGSLVCSGPLPPEVVFHHIHKICQKLLLFDKKSASSLLDDVIEAKAQSLNMHA